MKVYFKPDEKVLVIDGIKYTHKRTTYKKIDGIEHVDKELFVRLDEKKLKEKTELIKEKLKDAIPKDKLIGQVVSKMSVSEVNRIHKIITTKKPKITRQDGCLGVKIDGGKRNTAYVEIFD